MKRIDLDDPRLTAYALGELDASERAAIEAALEAHPECRALVDEIRQTATLLSAALAQEPCPPVEGVVPGVMAAIGAGHAQPAAASVEENAVSPSISEKVVPFPRRKILAIAVGIAASILILAVWQSASNPNSKRKGHSLAEGDKGSFKTVAVLTPAPVLRPTNEIQPPNHNTNVSQGLAAYTVPATNKVLAASLTLQDATLSQVIDLYESVSGRRVIRANNLPETKLNIRSESDVTRAEAAGALETILTMNQVTMIPQGEKFAKAVPQRTAPAEAAGFNEYSVALDSGAANQSRSYTITPNDSKYRVEVGTMAPLNGVSVSRTDNSLFVQNNLANPNPATGTTLAVNAVSGDGDELTHLGEIYGITRDGSASKRTALSLQKIRNREQEIRNREQEIRNRGLSASVSGTPPGGGYSMSPVVVADHASKIQSARFSPDGKRLITASGDESVRVWDTKTGKELGEVRMGIVAYAPFVENVFQVVMQQPLSTFSIDVDTASYANVRRFLNQNRLPPRDAVRIEELINYFSYNYVSPKGEDPFAAAIEVASCPWNGEHRLVRVALKGREMPQEKRPPSNFVFLIDISGSMQPAERLPLIKQGLRMLVKKMNEHDRVAIVVYASTSGVRLPSTSCAEKEKILAAIDALEAGGSTNGGEGIQQAYATAKENFIKSGVNRVILCTDGDFNVGITDQNELVRLIQEQAQSGIFLSALGVGTDNYKDALMQKLADKGNGNYHYLDTLEEAQKVLIEQMNATLVTIAKDVKIQIEFNPAQVSAYRLIGYEKRLLHKEDFNNDRKDAGEIGAGHTVTAFYEIVPAGRAGARPAVDALKYQPAVAPASYTANEFSNELLTLKLRYKQPDGNASKLVEFPASDSGTSYGKASADFKFATAVAAFGMILRDSEYRGSANFDGVLELAEEGKGADTSGYRAEFINLVKKAKALK